MGQFKQIKAIIVHFMANNKKVPIFFNHFLEARQNCSFLLEELKARKNAFEIFWPLKNNSYIGILLSNLNLRFKTVRNKWQYVWKKFRLCRFRIRENMWWNHYRSYYLAYHPELDMKEIVKRSCAVATISVQKEGTQTSFPYKNDLPKSMFSSW